MADQEGTITMSEVLERELALEEEAEAKLQENWGDENACTYDQGYITQPLYACGTCSAQGKSEVFGFCFGCSMNCHVDHDVYELFDKRHFKCDCGTPKSGCSCKFSEATRAQNNEENKYTHNFQAKYCWCDSTYDPDCIVCEDWFHHTCVARRTQIPDLSSFKGFLCHLCAAKHPLFLRYPQIQPNGQSTSTTDIPTNATSSTTTNQPTTATPSTTDQSTTATSSTTDKSTIDTNTTSTTNADNTNNNTTTKDTTKSESDTKENGKDTEKSTSEPQPCILDQHSDIFLIPEWRKGICKCPSCATMYHTDHLEFLLDDADDPDVGGEEEGEGDGEAEGETTGTGEAEVGAGEGRKRKISMLESAEKAFLENPQIPHNNKLNLITGFSDMKTELKEYLRKFAESGRVVTEADIAEFFEELRKKRQRI